MVLAFDKLLRSDAYKTEFMTENTDRFIVAIADGMGGHNAGEVASEEVLSNLKFFINDLPHGLTPGEMNEMMVEWIDTINKRVNSHGLMDPSKLEMGTTLVGILYFCGHYYWMNCGDSRLYRLRDGQLTQLTTDHSLLKNDGSQRHSNVITNCIGAGIQNSYIDFYEFTNDVLPGDAYLLCSDGLNDMITDLEIEELMVANKSANQLCEAAIEAGGFDNVSTCVFHIDK